MPRIARKISDQKLAGIHGVQFVTNFCCIQFWFVCAVPKYLNVFTFLTDLGAGLCSRPMYVRKCEVNILIKQLSAIADLHLPCAYVICYISVSWLDGKTASHNTKTSLCVE